MDSINYLYFIIIGFLFPSNFIGVIILVISLDIFEQCTKTGTYSIEFLQKLILQYKHKEKIMELVSYFVAYYVGHYIRNKFPL